MIQQRLKTAAAQAGLNAKEKSNVDALSKLLDTHQQLTNLPQQQAEQKFNSLPQDQQQSLVDMMGTETDKPKRGWFQNALHYAGKGLQALSIPSDFMTRVYRAQSIATFPDAKEKDLTYVWQEAGKGEGYFRPDKIQDAKDKYGDARVALAMKVRQGATLDEIIANGTESEKQLASRVAQDKDSLWQSAYDAVFASQVSPGRDVANALLPSALEGSGFLYKGISGTADAAYRVFFDPLLVLGKAKKAYDAMNYAIFKVAGNPTKIDQVFSKPAVTKFFDEYGSKLDDLDKARKAGDLKKATDTFSEIKRLAPEFGPSAVDEFIRAGVKDAQTAKNYLQNAADVGQILKGQAGRKTPLIPRLDARRRARVAIYTGANKVFNIDKVGQKVVQALYGTEPQYADITTGLNTAMESIAAVEKKVGRFKGKTGVERYSLDQIQGRIDRFARKFTVNPYFKDGFFDVMAPDASNKVYQVARLANSRYHAKIIQEAFQAGDEGQRKQIFTGLWNTVAEIRGVSKSSTGKSYMDQFANAGRNKMYSSDIIINGVKVGNPADFDGQQLALFPYQLSSGIAVPSVVDLDRLSARSGIISHIMGISHKRWADRLLSGWTIGTLAGPRFAIRNATEDLMMHLAIGDSPWGIVKGRMLSTRLRLAKGLGGGETAAQKAGKIVRLESQPGELGVINKFIRKNELDYFKSKLDEAATPKEVREVFAEAVLRSGLPQNLDKKSTEIIADIARYGNLDDSLRQVAEGSKNAFTGYDQYFVANKDASQFGKMGSIQIDGVKYKQAVGEKSFTQFNPVANQQSRISWLVQLGITTNDDLASIAVRYLDDEPRALLEMQNYLKNLPAAERNRFQLYSTGATEAVHAKKAYDSVRNMYSMRNGDINMDLLNKVRFVDDSGELIVSTKNLTIHDLPEVGDALRTPEYISGPTLVPVNDTGNFAGSVVERAWDFMGEANARFSREPIVINEMIDIRRTMDETGFTENVMKQLTRGKTGAELKKAEDYAKKHIIALTEEMAISRVLAYVDNPAVRTQLAMSARNFARFYRATEDFYRRISRAVRYNPESIQRAALTYEGVAHSGWVQTDDNGDQYFFYPGLTPVYNVMNNLLKTLNVGDAFQAPMPVEFAGKLKMITPSMNPDSLFPTFAGPLAAIPLKMIFNVVPQLEKIERATLGAYGEDQPMINAILPAHVNRLLAGLSRDERSSQYASAFRKAATYLEASGHGLKPTYDPSTKQWLPPTEGQRREFQDKLEASTITVLAVRFLFGFVAPASPQVTLKSDMARWVRENERTSYKQVFNNLVDKYGNIDKATEDWIRLFPDQMPYTISESEPTTVAIVKAVDSATEWIDKNDSLLKKYPQGAAFLIPKAGKFDFDAYKMLYKSGLKESKTLYDFLRQVQTARDEQFYYQQQDNYEATLASTYGDFAKAQLREQWNGWATQFKAARPLLQEELGQGAGRQIERLKALEDLTKMLADNTVKAEPDTRGKLKQMLDTYNKYIYTRDLVTSGGATAEAYKDLLKEQVKNDLQNIAQGNQNAVDAYTVLFSRLIRA